MLSPCRSSSRRLSQDVICKLQTVLCRDIWV